MQVFSPGFVLLLKLGTTGALIAVAALVFAWRGYTAPRPRTGEPVRQPVPFSHKHHGGDDGIDCRYCHSTVETSASAGMPSLHTCMTCHSQLFTDAPVLAPLRRAYTQGTLFAWHRVHDLPDFAYFDHSIHVTKGIGCSTCHGNVAAMPLTWRVASLRMQWCLACHRAPEKYLRPREEVFDMQWQAPADALAAGRRLMREYHIRSARELTQCSTCHR